MPGKIIVQTRKCSPLVHCITNYVTANDCANILLASGASAIMADDPAEAAEITAGCHGLVLNLGTPNPHRMEAMILAGTEANRRGLPVVLDPVGAGSSSLRSNFAAELLERLRFCAIRGNASEIAFLAKGTAGMRGVDADLHGHIPGSVLENARILARKTGAVIAVTGNKDFVADGNTCYCVQNGHSMMRYVTGTGCQLSALMGAYIAANPARPLQAVLAAVCAMGLCGEIAHERLSPMDGNASYRNYIIDAVYHLTPEMLQEGARYEVFQ